LSSFFGWGDGWSGNFDKLKGIGNGKASSVIYACEVGNQQKCREINKRGLELFWF
jgi:hypothetical protein